jgi:4-amino-4-deoxy-L-arabinose transferase-like glycosyltransferase
MPPAHLDPTGLTSIASVDRDEARFAQATRQMLETGDFVQIRFQHEARNKKPTGIHWLQAASVALFQRAWQQRDLALSPAFSVHRAMRRPISLSEIK